MTVLRQEGQALLIEKLMHLVGHAVSDILILIGMLLFGH